MNQNRGINDTSYDSKNAVCYFGHSGYKYSSGGYEGGSFIIFQFFTTLMVGSYAIKIIIYNFIKNLQLIK
jgi:hypothetical protein